MLAGCRRIIIKRPNFFDKEWSDKIIKYLSEAPDFAFSGKIDNYRKRLNIEEHFAFDLIIGPNEEIITFCGIYNNGRYPDGVFRILNRTFVAPEYRYHLKKFSGITSQLILKEQLQELASDLKYIFISREGVRADQFLNFWVKNFAPVGDWEVSKEYVQVVPGCMKKSCFHLIAFRKGSDINWNPQRISKEKWLELPK
jgi:hypothetical protein